MTLGAKTRHHRALLGWGWGKRSTSGAVPQLLCSDKPSHLPGTHWAPSPRICLPGTRITSLPPCPAFFTQVLGIKLTFSWLCSRQFCKPSPDPHLNTFEAQRLPREWLHFGPGGQEELSGSSGGSGLWEKKESEKPLLNNCTAPPEQPFVPGSSPQPAYGSRPGSAHLGVDA